MSTAVEFEPANAPLDGTNLIEASAGTGKTYNIVRLFLRLLLEPKLDGSKRKVGEILTVTFTRAATEELRERVRRLLQQALLACTDPDTAEPFLRDLIARLGVGPCRLQLLEALANFDEAPIFTIHGFCGRALSEFTFETRESFSGDVVTGAADLIRELVLDFWRRRIYPAPPSLVANLLENNFTPERLIALATLAVQRPEARLPEADCSETALLTERYEALFAEVVRLWQEQRTEVRALLVDAVEAGVLHKAVYHARSIELSCTAMDVLTRLGIKSAGSLDEALLRFLPQRLRDKTKANKRTPEHPFFSLWEDFALCQSEIAVEYSKIQNYLVTELVAEVRQKLPVRKDAEGILSYDDLVERIAAALTDPKRGPALKKGLRRRYSCALVDEFQDTDPLQWRIFSSLFGDAEYPLFLIGDPKQSIYGFRGADLHVYLEAARRADRRYTLLVNYRSTGPLLAAFNLLYARVNPFLIPGIEYHPVRPPESEQVPALMLGGVRAVPMRIVYPATPTGDFAVLTRGPAKDLIRDGVVAHVVDLLGKAARGEAALGERPVRPADIAVLLRTNREAEEMRQALELAGVRSVLRMERSLFDSDEARELFAVLRAVENPSRADYLREALATELLGWNASDLLGLEEDDRALSDQTVRFRRYRELWHQRGFMHMFQELLQSESVSERLLSLTEGERRMTNVLHLGEVLHREGRHRRGTELRMLGSETPANVPEEHLIRLESDEEAVQVVTAHLSKGLQYPIVIVPFGWSLRSWNAQDLICAHRSGDGQPLQLATSLLRGREPEAALADLNGVIARGTLEEELRLLYVAMTRARSHCTLVWGAIKASVDTAPAFLLHRRNDPEPMKGGNFAYVDPPELAADLIALVEAGRGNLEVGALHEALSNQAAAGDAPTVKPVELVARDFDRELPEPFRIRSFTSLAAAAGEAPAELPDHDIAVAGTAQPGDTVPPRRSVFSLPRGGRTGVFFHRVLELYFQGERTDLPELVREVATGFGLSDWTDVALTMVERALKVRVPLWEDRGVRDKEAGNAGREQPMAASFRLSDTSLADLPVSDCLTEMQFYYPAGVDYMTGFVDLVFRSGGRYYILDWKTNYLGDAEGDYAPQRLEAIMRRDAYHLQYKIYAHALDRYLSDRDPNYSYESAFGGIVYVFLRGLGERVDGSTGLFFVRPDAEQVRAFSIGEGGVPN